MKRKGPGKNARADADVLRRSKSAIAEVVSDAEVILYGSRARGSARQDSDYDVLVLIDGPVNMALEDRMRAQLYPLELETGAVITLMVFSRKEWDSAPYRAMPFRRNVEREGVRL